MPENQQPVRKIVFAGRTEEERIESAMMFQIGIGIVQRYDQAFTPNEHEFMRIALAQFARSSEQHEGVKVQPQAAPAAVQPAGSDHPPVQQHPPAPRPKR